MGGQHHAPAALTLGKTRYPLYMWLGEPKGRSECVRKISPPRGFDPRTIQPVASLNTDCAIRITCSSQVSLLTTVKGGRSRLRRRFRWTAGLAVRNFLATTLTSTKDNDTVGAWEGRWIDTGCYEWISLKLKSTKPRFVLSIQGVPKPMSQTSPGYSPPLIKQKSSYQDGSKSEQVPRYPLTFMCGYPLGIT